MENKRVSEDDFLLISGIQHFSFCRRQWALIHIEQQWSENRLTAQGNLIHSRVHDSRFTDMRNGILTIRDMPVKSNLLGVTGCCDAVEFIPCEDGVSLYGRSGKWMPYPVEYKHGKSKVNDCDRLQVTAQSLCLEEMLCCDIPEAAIYYHETRRREKIALTQELRDKTRSVIAEMHELYERGYTPKVKAHAGCKNCSLSEICMPKLMKGKKAESVDDYIHMALKEDTE